MRTKKYRLKKLTISEISLVDRPAVRRFVLFKSMEAGGVPDDMDGRTFVEKIQAEWDSMTDEQREAIAKEIERTSALLDLMFLDASLAKVKTDDPFKWASIDTNPAQWDFNQDTGEFTKREDFIAHPEAQTKSHYFDYSDFKWHKKSKVRS